MAEPRARDIAEPTPAENLLPETATRASLGAMPRSAQNIRLEGDAGLKSTARRVGSKIGDAAASVRQVQERIKVVPRRMSELKRQMAERSNQAAQQISETAQKSWSQARERTAQARRQIVKTSQEKPFHVLAVAAGAAFALGVGLRIWRGRD